MSSVPSPKGPPARRLAPHVQAAVQPRASASPPARPAPHVQAALQPKVAAGPVAKPAPHVQKMMAVAQGRMHSSPQLAGSPAPHVQAGLKLPMPPTSRASAGPQPTAGVSGAVQPFSEKKIGKNKGRLSQNGNYFVTSGALYVKDGATSPVACNATLDKIGKNYKKHEGSTLFLKDCLHTAEEILSGKTLKYGSGIASVSRETGEDIGNSDKENIKVAQKVANRIVAM